MSDSGVVNVACQCGRYVEHKAGEYLPVICDDCLRLAAEAKGYVLEKAKKHGKQPVDAASAADAS